MYNGMREFFVIVIVLYKTKDILRFLKLQLGLGVWGLIRLKNKYNRVSNLYCCSEVGNMIVFIFYSVDSPVSTNPLKIGSYFPLLFLIYVSTIHLEFLMILL